MTAVSAAAMRLSSLTWVEARAQSDSSTNPPGWSLRFAIWSRVGGSGDAGYDAPRGGRPVLGRLRARGDR